MIIKFTDISSSEEHLSDCVRDGMKTWNKTISLLCNDEQQIVANGYPDLRVNGVLGCSVEGLNMQMLFDPFEEQLNLPTFTVQFRNGQRIFDREVIGKEVIDLASFKVFIHNKSERIRIFLDGVVPIRRMVSSERTPEFLSTGMDSMTS